MGKQLTDALVMLVVVILAIYIASKVLKITV